MIEDNFQDIESMIENYDREMSEESDLFDFDEEGTELNFNHEV